MGANRPPEHPVRASRCLALTWLEVGGSWSCASHKALVINIPPCVFFPPNSSITTEFQNIKLSCLALVDLTVSNIFLPASLLGLIPVQAVLPALSPQPVTLPFLKKLPMHN